MLSRWMWSSYTRPRLEPQSRKKISMTVIAYMGCKVAPMMSLGRECSLLEVETTS